MKRSSLFVFVLSLLTAANAQTPQQSPTPSSATSDDVVRISTNLIQLDVTVTGNRVVGSVFIAFGAALLTLRRPLS